MKLKTIKYDGTEMIYEALSFEFRTNQVSNWVKIKLNNGETIIVHNICVIKSIE